MQNHMNEKFIFFIPKRMTQELARFKVFSILGIFSYFSLHFTFLLKGT